MWQKHGSFTLCPILAHFPTRPHLILFSHAAPVWRCHLSGGVTCLEVSPVWRRHLSGGVTCLEVSFGAAAATGRGLSGSCRPPVSGVPRYTYAASDGALFTATVVLPSGRIIRGGGAPSREQVSGLAAWSADTAGWCVDKWLLIRRVLGILTLHEKDIIMTL